MSLFICMECGCVENSNLVSENINTNPEHPNLCRMEMDGYNYVNDERGEVKYLCSECNTGTWHGEFKKTEATETEKEIASYSATNMITPADHPEGCIAGGYDNYYVDDKYKLFVKLFGKDVNRDNNKLFRIYLEDRMNFNINCLLKLDINASIGFGPSEEDIKNAMARSQIYFNSPTDIKSKTYLKEVLGINSSFRRRKSGLMLDGIATMFGLDMDSMVDSHFRNKNPKEKHWKETQSETDKDLKLRKARLKREIKSLKKQKPTNTDLLNQITKEYKEL